MNTSHVSPWRIIAFALVAASILAATGRAADDPKSLPFPNPTQSKDSIRYHPSEGLMGLLAHLSEKHDIPLKLETYVDTQFGGLRIGEYRITPGSSIDLKAVSGTLKVLDKVDKVSTLYSIYENSKSEFESRGITGAQLINAWVTAPKSIVFAFENTDAGIKALNEGLTSASAVSIRFATFGLVEVHGPEIEKYVSQFVAKRQSEIQTRNRQPKAGATSPAPLTPLLKNTPKSLSENPPGQATGPTRTQALRINDVVGHHGIQDSQTGSNNPVKLQSTVPSNASSTTPARSKNSTSLLQLSTDPQPATLTGDKQPKPEATTPVQSAPLFQNRSTTPSKVQTSVPASSSAPIPSTRSSGTVPSTPSVVSRPPIHTGDNPPAQSSVLFQNRSSNPPKATGAAPSNPAPPALETKKSAIATTPTPAKAAVPVTAAKPAVKATTTFSSPTRLPESKEPATNVSAKTTIPSVSKPASGTAPYYLAVPVAVGKATGKEAPPASVRPSESKSEALKQSETKPTHVVQSGADKTGKTLPATQPPSQKATPSVSSSNPPKTSLTSTNQSVAKPPAKSPKL